MATSSVAARSWSVGSRSADWSEGGVGVAPGWGGGVCVGLASGRGLGVEVGVWPGVGVGVGLGGSGLEVVGVGGSGLAVGVGGSGRAVGARALDTGAVGLRRGVAVGEDVTDGTRGGAGVGDGLGAARAATGAPMLSSSQPTATMDNSRMHPA